MSKAANLIESMQNFGYMNSRSSAHVSGDNIEAMIKDIFIDILTTFEDNLNFMFSNLLGITDYTGHLTLTRGPGSKDAYPIEKSYGDYVLYDNESDSEAVVTRVTIEYSEKYDSEDYGKFWWSFHFRKVVVNGETSNRPISFIPTEVTQSLNNFSLKTVDDIKRLKIEIESIL